MDQSFLNRLDMLRQSFGGPLVLTSAFRCKAYNEKIKGAKDSQHMHGLAVDIAIAEPEKRWRLIACAATLGFSLGIDGAFLHVDTGHSPKIAWVYPGPE